MTIYDQVGRKVYDFYVNKAQNSGYQQFIWDGTDASGNPVPADVHILRLQTEHGIRTKVISRIR
jgi:flagellar hook assembly protein FlgD